jgi:putative transposase
MLFEELHVDITDSSDVEFLNTDRTRTPAWFNNPDAI